MTATWIELAQTLAASLAFALFFLPPGFLAGYLLNIFGMRRASRAEQLLWSLVLSVPLALLLAQGLGRLFPGWGVISVFVLLAIAAVALLAASRQPNRPASPSGTHFAFAAAFVLLLYSVFATLDVQIGSRLFTTTLANDWSVRLPMVAAASHGRVPPLNPLSAIGGPAAHLRYYYFWYVLCAEPMRMLHVSAHAALSASAFWAALALFAVSLLCLRHLAGERAFSRRRVQLLIVALLVIGLDAVRAFPDLLRRKALPDLEWWRPDRTPGFLTTALNSPHHLAGLVCCLVAILLVVDSCDAKAPDASLGLQEQPRLPLLQLAGRAALIGCAFAACAGTSTFLVFIFLAVCVLLGLVLLLTREFRAAAVLIASGVVARALANPYLAELKGGTSGAHGFASVTLRSSSAGSGFFQAHHLFQHHPAAAVGLYVLVFAFLELGFFFFVLLDRFRSELLPALRRRRPLSNGQRALWIMFLGGALNALFLSSKVTLSANDLGMHSGMLVRFILAIWAVPFLHRLLVRSNTAPGYASRSFRWAALACLALGLLAEAENLVLERFYFPLMEAHVLHGPTYYLTADRLSYRLSDLQSAWRWIDTQTPASARAQGNPGGMMAPAFDLFSDRQLVAQDLGCGTSFGGDPAPCPAVISDLRQLYGGFPAEERDQLSNHETPAPRPTQASTAADFQRLCAQYGLQYVIADQTDPAWEQRDSWIWSVQPLFSTATARVFGCGAA